MSAPNPFRKIAHAARASAKEQGHDNDRPNRQTCRCPQCGAPRISGSDIARCQYCGHRHMAVSVQVDANGQPVVRPQ